MDLSEGTREEREVRTSEEVEKKSAVIYQPAMVAVTTLDGVPCQVVGEPDFFLEESGRVPPLYEASPSLDLGLDNFLIQRQKLITEEIGKVTG